MIDYTHQYLCYLTLRRSSPTAIAARRRLLRRVETDMGVSLFDATEADLAGWYGRLSRRVTPQTQLTQVSGVAAFYHWANLMEIRPDNPTAKLPRPRLSTSRPRPISPKDLAKAMGTAPPRIRSAMLLGAYAGLRAAEIAAAQRTHLREGSIWVRGKGGRERIVPAHPLVAAQYAAGQPWVIARLDGHAGPCAPWLISHIVSEHLHSCGLDETCHSLRHYFGTQLYQRTHDLRMVQELMGHQSPTTTAIYAEWSREGAAEAIAGLDDVA